MAKSQSGKIALPLSARNAASLRLIGGHPSLDFCNTAAVHIGSGRQHLTRYADLAAWCHHAGLVTAAELRQLLLLSESAGNRPQAQRIFQRAIQFRERLFRVLAALAAGNEPPSKDLAQLGSAIRRVDSARVLKYSSGELLWQRNTQALELAEPLARLIDSAADCIAHVPSTRIKKCANYAVCDWLFIDHSKNRSRRWCSMAFCGNTTKAKRHYQRASAC